VFTCKVGRSFVGKLNGAKQCLLVHLRQQIGEIDLGE